MSTVILKCNCKSEFQDKTYGSGLRLHNTSGIKDKKIAYCTVCQKRSSDKQLKDVLANENRAFGVTFDTRAEKPRNGKNY